MSVPEKLTHDALPRASTNLSMRNISLDDLDFLERDLLFYEKVSVCFLLHREVRDLSYILQQLTIALKVHRSGNVKDTKIISDWVRNDPDYKWREHLVEALAIVKSHKVLRKLGFELKDVQEAFLPHIDEISTHVHPVLKILYKMCEKMRQKDRKLLIHYMLNKFECENFGLDGENFLEMYLLNWIQQKIITIGDRDTIGAEFGELVAFLKMHEIDEFYEKLKRFTTTSLDATIEGNSPERQERNNARPETCEVRSNMDYFPMNTKKMGYVVIVNEKNFHKEEGVDIYLTPGNLETRHGTEKDVSKLCNTFKSLGFCVVVRNDLKSDEILTTVSGYVEKTQNGFSSLIIVILSHGIEGSVYGANSVPLEIRSIKNVLCTDELKDKPKILILQACQNNDSLLNGQLKNDAPSRVDAFANLLTAHSTVEGFNSMRHTTQGTWFIQTLCEKIEQLHTREHFVDILTHVTNEVATKVGDDGQKMIPKVEMTLKKKLYLSSHNKF